MKEEKEQTSSSQSGALGEFIVLSPSQKREQERLQKEKAKKDAAEREKRRIAAEKRRAEEKAEEEAFRRQAFRNNLVGVIFATMVLGIATLVICSAILFFAAFGKDGNNPDFGIMWWGVAISVGVALVYFLKNI